MLNFPLMNHYFPLLTFSNIFSNWNRNWANFLLSHVCQTGLPWSTNWLTVVWFLVQKELFYTDCQRWSYLFESCAVLSLMKIHKKPHVSISEDGTTVQYLVLYKSNYACILRTAPQKQCEKNPPKKWLYNMYDKQLIDWVRSGWTGKYLAIDQDAQTSSQIFSRPALPLSQ